MSQDIETLNIVNEKFIVASEITTTKEHDVTSIPGIVMFHYSREQIGIISADIQDKSTIHVPSQVHADEDWLFIRPFQAFVAVHGECEKICIELQDILTPLFEEGVDNFVGKQLEVVHDDQYFIVLDVANS